MQAEEGAQPSDEAKRLAAEIAGLRQRLAQAEQRCAQLATQAPGEPREADAAFLRSVLASSDDCIKVLDLDANLVFMSEGGQRVMEVSDFNAIRGCPWPDFWHGEGNADARAAVQAAKAGGTGHFQGLADTMAGNPRYWDVQVTPILGTDGQPEKLLSVSRDITATQQAREALRMGEARWRRLFERLHEGFVLAELVRGQDGRATDWRYLDVNPAWGRLVGIAPADAVGRTIRELFRGIEDSWVDEMAEVVETGLPVAFLRQVGLTGRWYEGHAFRLEGERFAILFFEVTGRMQGEARRTALLELDARLHDIDDLADMAFVAAEMMGRTLGVARAGYGTLDADGTVLLVRRDWTAPGIDSVAGRHPLRDYGSFVEELRRGEIVVVADARQDPRTAATAGSLDAVGTRALVNMPLIERGRLVALFFVNQAGPRAWTEDEVGFLRTVAERTRATIERRRAEGELRVLAASLEAQVAQRTHALMAAEAALRQSQKMEAVGQLTGGLAHDFNNLLTGVMGSLELLQTRIGQGRLKDVDRYLLGAQGAARKAAALTHRLLAFSRQQTLDPRPTDVNRLVSGMEELVRRTMRPEIAIELVAAPGLWTTLVDPGQLENALLNLCINARDAMPGGGRLTIETANHRPDGPAPREPELPAGQYVSLCVHDTGTGMAPDVIARAFDPFFTTKPLGQGTGLGLSMVYGFARQSGGEVRIASEPGQGTMVCLHLPRHFGAATETQATAELADAPRAGRGESVLVVDDEPGVRMLVTEVLEDLGYTAIEAADGPAGLLALQSGVRVDLLVTDVGLPGGMNGRQLAEAARLMRPGLKVLFITGYAESAVVGQDRLEPGMHVLTKPFAMEILASRIRTLIVEGG